MQRRKEKRVLFRRGIPVRIMEFDGISSHPATMEDVSSAGAKLTLPAVLPLPNQFYITLTSTGSVLSPL